MPSESDVLKACAQVLSASPHVMAWRSHSGMVKIRGGFMHLAPKGTADFTGMLRGGRFIGIEVKRDVKSKKTNNAIDTLGAQKAWAERVTAMGGIAITVTSAQELSDRLRELTEPGAEVFGGVTTERKAVGT